MDELEQQHSASEKGRTRRAVERLGKETAPDQAAQMEDAEEEQRRAVQIDWLAKLPAEDPNPIVCVDGDGSILYSNRASWRLLERWGCRGKKSLPDQWRRIVLGVLDAGHTQYRECQCGDRVYALTFAPLPAANRVNIYALEITDRKRVERRLQVSEERLYLAMEAVDDILWDWNIRTDEVYYSPHLAALLGLDPSEVAPSSRFLQSRLHPDEKANVLKHIHSHLAGETWCIDIEHRLRTESGQWRWVLGRGQVVERDQDGAPLRAIGSFTDVHDRKQAEHQLSFKTALLTAQSEASLDAILFVDSQGRTLPLNRRFAEMWNVPHDVIESQIAGRLLRVVTSQLKEPTRFVEQAKSLYAHARHSEKDQLELVDGRTLEWHSSPLLGPGGEHYGRLWYFRDVTERQQVHEFLRKARESAEAMNRAKSEFLANMSHEIRTPMTAILGFCDLLMSGDLPTHEHRDYLDGIQRNGKTLLELINDILDLSRIEADKLVLDASDCLLTQIIDDVASMVKVRAEEKGLELTVDYRRPLPEILHTDTMRLRQILVNLVSNAVKFTERGEVRITVRRDKNEQETSRLEFAISDTGPGIPADKIEQLFRPFTQMDGSASRRHGGTGLGLAISRRLARALGGDIRVSSETGRGSTFTVTLPISTSQTARPTPQPASRQPADAAPAAAEKVVLRGRVLLAEDVPDVHRVLAQVLRKMDLGVEVAEDGCTACQLAEKSRAEGKPYDLILMDIQMPTMNGYEATRWLRHHQWHGPIVALTAHAMRGDREQCLEAGCNDYITKPITIAGLQELLRRYLGATGGTTCATGFQGVNDHGQDGRATSDPSPEPTGLLAGGPLDAGRVAQLVTWYAEGLPGRASAVDSALKSDDLQLVKELAHQIKGSAGLYGYTLVSKAAQVIHQRIAEANDAEHIRAAVADLLRLCNSPRDEDPNARSGVE